MQFVRRSWLAGKPRAFAIRHVRTYLPAIWTSHSMSTVLLLAIRVTVEHDRPVARVDGTT
jgi:hypothetical protein